MLHDRYQELENNIIEIIKEEQIKLGYQEETLRLYYPLSSLNQFIGAKADAEQMERLLEGFSAEEEKILGRVGISRRGERFCLAVPPQGMRYVHEHMGENEFLARFIQVIQKHGCTIEDILEVFRAYSSQVCVEKMEGEEFDYLLYFKDGKPDQFRYCITFEECHVIYHRFTEADYEEMMK